MEINCFYCSVSFVSVPQATRSSVFLIIPQLPAARWGCEVSAVWVHSSGLMTGGLRWACEHYRMIHDPGPRLWAQMIKWCQNAASNYPAPGCAFILSARKFDQKVKNQIGTGLGHEQGHIYKRQWPRPFTYQKRAFFLAQPIYPLLWSQYPL